MHGDDLTETSKPHAALRAATHLGAAARHLSRAALDLIFPPACISCREAIAAHGALCPACWGQVRFIERPFCDRLGTPFAADLGAEGLLSPEAIAHPPVYARARAVARFEDGPVRHLIHRLKYGDRLELALPLGRQMARAGRELLAEADLLVPIPLHRGRLFWRRFNQANALAEVISKASKVQNDPFVLERTKATPSQVGLTKVQRAENMHGAFAVPEAEKIKIEGRALVLIDDVLTSGATLNAAARVLLRAGAARVDALVFARVVTGA
ncbi:ComF family protein [Methyloferula stellata]|uniref:ComF family protein n=1 Tax=Methyloferula stellata TaxID=876270 RepID=UPI0003776491|nr:ComF family protein [Methyloferula stellata]